MGNLEKSSWIKNIFKTILEAKILAKRWQDYYNIDRPHSSLGYMTPKEYKNEAGEIPLGRLGSLFLPVKEKTCIGRSLYMKNKKSKLKNGRI